MLELCYDFFSTLISTKEAFIFSAEIYAINLALDLISTSNSKKKKNYHPHRLNLSSSITQIHQIGKSTNYQDL